MTADRLLAWDGCVNVRDLGGLPTEAGGETRFRAVVRADSIRGLSDVGWAALADYGVRAAIDLRAAYEWDEDPPGEVPIPLIRIPIAPRDAPVAFNWPSMLEAYLALLEQFQPQYAEVIDTVGREEPAVVIHCSGGRDRTGLAAALLLRLAGVDPDTIAADHALSDRSWGPHNEEWFAEASTVDERERRRRIAAPAGRTMAEVLAQVDGRYGSVVDYLLAGGATKDGLAAAARRLTG